MCLKIVKITVAGMERKKNKNKKLVNEKKGKARSISRRPWKEAGHLCKGNRKSPESLVGERALTHILPIHSNLLMLPTWPLEARTFVTPFIFDILAFPSLAPESTRKYSLHLLLLSHVHSALCPMPGHPLLLKLPSQRLQMTSSLPKPLLRIDPT